MTVARLRNRQVQGIVRSGHARIEEDAKARGRTGKSKRQHDQRDRRSPTGGHRQQMPPVVDAQHHEERDEPDRVSLRRACEREQEDHRSRDSGRAPDRSV
jgi:hypothetical protein